MNIQLSASIRSDLQEIAKNSRLYALEMVQRLRNEFQVIAANPFLYQLRPELGEGLSIAPAGKYLVLFRISEDTVYSERVLHGMRDLPQQFQWPASDCVRLHTKPVQWTACSGFCPHSP